MNKTKNIVTGITLLALAIFLIYTVIMINTPVEKRLQGEIEARQIKVSSKLSGRIDSIPVRKGMNVQKGDLLLTIGSPEVHARLQQAVAGKEAASAQGDKATKGARSEDIEVAYSNYQKAQAAAELASKTHQRIKNLYEDGVVPEQKLDDASAQKAAAMRTAEAAKALYKKARNGTRNEDIKAAQAMVEKAEATIEEVQSFLDETRITAPISGEVADIISKEGELIPSGFPAITLVDLNDVWMTLHVKETMMKDIKKGTAFHADIPALRKKEVPFRVTYIHPLGDYATWKATKSKGDFDIKTFGVEARPVKPVEDLRPGMSVLIDKDAFKTISNNDQ